jgi:hypothetical protein
VSAVTSVKAAVAAGVALAAATASTPSWAVEREQHVGVDLGGAMLVLGSTSKPDIGGSAGAHWTYGLSDAFNLMVEGSWSLLELGTPEGKNLPKTLPSWAANADVGVAYVLDVLQWVPYVGVLGGGYAFSGGTIDGAKLLPGVAIALGLDYRVRPNLSLGVAVRQHIVSETQTYTSFSQALARIEYNWGW